MVLFDIEDYVGLYSVTKNGDVFSWRSNKFLKPIQQSNGYLTVNLHKDKKFKTKTIHRLVANAFIENTFNKPCVNHKDLDKTNNHVSNLEWVSHKENIQHACDNGIRCGEKNGNAKLTPIQVKEIRAKYKFRKYTYEQLSKEYNVMKHYIGRIVNRVVWKHI